MPVSKKKTSATKKVVEKKLSTTKASPVKKVTTKTANKKPVSKKEVTSQENLLENRVAFLEEKLSKLIDTLHTEFRKEMRKGPRGVAKSLEPLL